MQGGEIYAGCGTPKSSSAHQGAAWRVLARSARDPAHFCAIGTDFSQLRQRYGHYVLA